jgi:hypothetical protein
MEVKADECLNEVDDSVEVRAYEHDRAEEYDESENGCHGVVLLSCVR